MLIDILSMFVNSDFAKKIVKYVFNEHNSCIADRLQ